MNISILANVARWHEENAKRCKQNVKHADVADVPALKVAGARHARIAKQLWNIVFCLDNGGFDVVGREP